MGCKEKFATASNTTPTPFYLNYVGCKGYSMPQTMIKKVGFTLTMWDVKKQALKQFKKDNNSFTLTMWDVKK